MPLPPALAARLAKRGIILKEEPKKVTQEVEEVFAEDYDEPQPQIPAPEVSLETEEEPIEEVDTDPSPLIHDVLNCPNVNNTFHECVEFCRKRWGMKPFETDSETDRRRQRMLRKYPLPDGWKEVADPTTGRYYYWNTQTDEVSWLSPVHPRSRVTQPAEKPKELPPAVEEKTEALIDDGMEVDFEDLADKDFEELEREVLAQKSSRDRRGKRKEKDELDPMDPASYSDIPRGTWSTGLDRRGSAKTGADVTASGPLFQQRPYPSPGDVLRANRDNQK